MKTSFYIMSLISLNCVNTFITNPTYSGMIPKIANPVQRSYCFHLYTGIWLCHCFGFSNHSNTLGFVTLLLNKHWAIMYF